MAFEGLDAAAAFGAGAGVAATGGDEFPHLNGLVQTTGYEILSVWCECNGIYGILVAVWAFKTLDEITSSSIPDSHTLVEGSRCNILGVGGDGDGGDAIFDAEGQDVLTSFDIP